MRPSLIIFIDCFPHRYLDSGFLSMLSGRAGVRPGFGYSVNIVAELFAGKTPDELGTFNIFGYNPDNEWLASSRPMLRALAPLKRWYLADRIAHRVLTWKAGYTGNIPFEHIGYFEPAGTYPFADEFPHGTVFSAPGFDGGRIFHSDLEGVRPPDRDPVLVARAKSAVRPGQSIFLSLSDLDAQAHAHGVGSPEFMRRIEEYDLWLSELIEEFSAANPDGYVALVSDHGAANTTGVHDLKVEEHLGKARPGRYMYFLDATIARFWVEDDGYRDEVERFLESQPHGQLVTDDERAEYGLRSRAFGDFIWVVEEGLGISPSFLGRGLSRSLHGYHPALESQRAVMLTSEPLSAERYTSTEVHEVLSSRMAMTTAGSEGR